MQILGTAQKWCHNFQGVFKPVWHPPCNYINLQLPPSHRFWMRKCNWNYIEIKQGVLGPWWKSKVFSQFGCFLFDFLLWTSQKWNKGITGSSCHYVIICHLSASQRVIRNIVSSCWSGNVICSIWFNFHIQQSNCTPKRRGEEAKSSFVSWSLWWWAWVNRESTVLPLWTSLFPFYHFWPFSKWLITDR